MPATSTAGQQKREEVYLSLVEGKHRAQRVVDAYEKFKADPSAFDALLVAVRDYVYRKLHRLETKAEGFGDIGTAATVDDWAQDVLLKVWRHREQFNGQTGVAFLCWIRTIVDRQRSDSANYLVKAKHTKVPLTLVGEDGEAYDNPTVCRDEVSYHDPRERRVWAGHIPDEIQGADRRIVVLLMGGKSFSDVAYALNFSPQALANRVARLRKKLRGAVLA